MIPAASPTLTSCPRCGSPLAGGSVQGLCARCLGALPLMATETLIGATGMLETLPPPTIGELAEFFPQLELLGYLGRGGMGVVYQARQRSLDRLVALKLLAPERAGDPAFARRFAREARSLAALNHPHIVAVYDSGEAGGYFYLLMEYVDGENLRELLRKRRLAPAEALDLIGPVCDALERAHRRGIIHRDIKPENLLIDRTGVVKIADFGISRMLGEVPEDHSSGGAAALHAPTLAIGTPAYAAPEQLAAAALDPRADLYSLGVVLCEMLTGLRPDQKMLVADPVIEKLPGKVRAIMAKTLQAEPDARFASAAELRRSVTQAREALEREPRQRKLWMRAGIAGVVAMALLWGIPALLAGHRAAGSGSSPGKQRMLPLAMGATPKSREEALQRFEKNFTELMEARRRMAVELPQDGGDLAALLEKIRGLEAGNEELRAWIGTHPGADGGGTP